MLSLTLVTTDVASYAVTVFTRLRITGTSFIFLMSTFTGFSTVMAFRSFAVGYFHTSTTLLLLSERAAPVCAAENEDEVFLERTVGKRV